MITYEKINSEYSNIFYNGLQIGRVEVYKYSKKYIVDVRINNNIETNEEAIKFIIDRYEK